MYQSAPASIEQSAGTWTSASFEQYARVRVPGLNVCYALGLFGTTDLPLVNKCVDVDVAICGV